MFYSVKFFRKTSVHYVKLPQEMIICILPSIFVGKARSKNNADPNTLFLELTWILKGQSLLVVVTQYNYYHAHCFVYFITMGMIVNFEYSFVPNCKQGVFHVWFTVQLIKLILVSCYWNHVNFEFGSLRRNEKF